MAFRPTPKVIQALATHEKTQLRGVRTRGFRGVRARYAGAEPRCITPPRGVHTRNLRGVRARPAAASEDCAEPHRINPFAGLRPAQMHNYTSFARQRQMVCSTGRSPAMHQSYLAKLRGVRARSLPGVRARSRRGVPARPGDLQQSRTTAHREQQPRHAQTIQTQRFGMLREPGPAPSTMEPPVTLTCGLGSCRSALPIRVGIQWHCTCLN